MHPTKSDHSTTSPFEEIRSAEGKEAQRVEKAKRKYEDDTLEKLRKIDAQKTEKSSALRSSMNAELEVFGPEEISTAVRDAKSAAKKDVADLDTQASKKRQQSEDELLKKALDPSFLFS